MTSDADIERAFNDKKIFFEQGHTKSYSFRITQLKRLRNSIKKFEGDLLTALHKDMHKAAMEAYISEVGFVYHEIAVTLKRLKRWMKPARVGTPLALHPSTSRVYPEPLGVVLIISPWNYPVNLSITPLIGAIAAGNCAIIKPSNNTQNTVEVIERIVSDAFDSNYVSVVKGPGEMIGPRLIEKHSFNHIFFSGSPEVGKQVMAMAAKHLTPVTLELGGKSPVIVDCSADIDISAKRIVWGKFFNAGQTCICPDYLIVHHDVKDALLSCIKKYIVQFYGDNPEHSPCLTHIINEKRFNKLIGYLKDVHIVHGGRSSLAEKYIEPTVVDEIPENHPLLKDEIFGPILPVLTYKNTEEVVQIVKKNGYPLSCYIFTKNKAFERQLVNTIEFGGGCINNTIVHIANPHLPFGGVGNSGMGRYHGKYSFDVFSNYKSIVKTSTLIDPMLKYPPYSERKYKWIRRLM